MFASIGTEEAFAMTKLRTRAALVLLTAAIILNFIILVRAEESAGWPVAAIVLLGAVGASLLTQQRGQP
jgi:hypothetical protein